MKTYIPKQPKHTRERIEAKLDARLVRRLEHYCEYLESDRDYVLSQLLELIFRKDKGFGDWLALRKAAGPSTTAESVPIESRRRGGASVSIGGTE